MRKMKKVLMFLFAVCMFMCGAVFVHAQAEESLEPLTKPETYVSEGITVEKTQQPLDETQPMLYSSYPMIYLDAVSSNPTIPYGETATLKFIISSVYTYEYYFVEIYDSNGEYVGGAGDELYNSSAKYWSVSLAVDTAELEMTPGEYTVEFGMEYRDSVTSEWVSAPEYYVTDFVVVQNLCNGNHTLKQDSVIYESTCVEAGIAYMVCSRCGHGVYQEIPLADHSWDDGCVTVEPTMDETGVRTYTCAICDETKTESIPALGTAPSKPYKIANVVSGVHVYWNAVEGARKYGLWRSETGKDGTYKWVGNPTVAHFTDTKVESGKTYYYKVTILNTDKNIHTEKSEAIGITFVSTPDISLRVNRAHGIGLGWEKIDGAQGYAIYRKSYYGNDAWVRVATIEDANTLKWDDTSVKNNNGEVYKYTIRALAGSNLKTLSGCRNTGRTMVRLTSRTLNSAQAVNQTSIKCSWGTTTQATGYEVRFMVGNEVYKCVTIGNYKTGTKTFDGLESGKTYKIQVRTYKTVDGVGSFYSAWSTAKNVTLE